MTIVTPSLLSAHCAPICKYRPNGNAHSLFQSQAYRSRAMWPCCDFTSSDDDEHKTDNNFLLLFADVDITPTLLEGLSEVDVLHIALGCRFALEIFTISQQYYTRLVAAMMAKSLGQRSWKVTHIPNRTLCWQNSRLHCVSYRHSAPHHSHFDCFASSMSLRTSHFTLAPLSLSL